MVKFIELGALQKAGPATINGIATKVRGTSARILEAATALLIAEGYEGLSMRKVGSMVALSQAAIYRHYKDKSALVEAIVEHGYSRLKAGLDTALVPGASAAESLSSGIRAYIIFAIHNPSLFKAVMLQDLGRSQRKIGTRKTEAGRTSETFGRLTGLIRRGVNDGEFCQCDIETTAQAVWAAMFGMAASMSLEVEDPDIESCHSAKIERLIEVLVEGLRGSKPRRGYEQ